MEIQAKGQPSETGPEQQVARLRARVAATFLQPFHPTLPSSPVGAYDECRQPHLVWRSGPVDSDLRSRHPRQTKAKPFHLLRHHTAVPTPTPAIRLTR